MSERERFFPPCSQLEPISVVEVFAGAAGFFLGWEFAANEFPNVKVRLRAAIDSDVYSEEFYDLNFPEAQFLRHEFGDASRQNEADHVVCNLNIAPQDCDVLLAGPPCQTFSAAGKRRLLPESQLAFHVVDLARLLAPSVILIENVPEFARAYDGRLVGRIRTELSAIGYESAIAQLDAFAFGLPQRRKRCFLLACNRHLGWPHPNLILRTLVENQFHKTHQRRTGHLAPSGVCGSTSVSQAIDDLPSLAAGEGYEIVYLENPPTSEYQRMLRQSDGITYNHVASRHSPKTVRALANLEPGATPQRLTDHPLGKRSYFRLAYSRLHPDEPASTITTQTHNAGSGRFTHYRDHRTITVREAARLQSFPDRVRFTGPLSVQRRQVGNATPPLMSQAIARILIPLIRNVDPTANGFAADLGLAYTYS